MTELGKKQRLVRWFIQTQSMPTPLEFKRFAKVRTNRALVSIIGRWYKEDFVRFTIADSKILLIPGDWSEFDYRGWGYKDKFSKYYD